MTLTEIETVVAAYEAALKARQALPERIPIENEELSAQAHELNAVKVAAWHALVEIAPDAVYKLLPIAKAAVKVIDAEDLSGEWDEAMNALEEAVKRLD